MAVEKFDEMLAHHAGGAEDANFDSVFAHNSCLTIFDKFQLLRVTAPWDAFFERVRHVDGSWPQKNGCAPWPPSAGMSVVYATTVVGNPSSARSDAAPEFQHEIQFAPRRAPHGFMAAWRGIAHQADENLGACASSGITLGARPP
jgi:hypothetical protein